VSQQRDEKASISSQEAAGTERIEVVVPTESPIDAAPTHPADLIRLPIRHNPTLQRVLEAINADEDLHTIWRCQNIIAVDRLGMSDHGPVHMQIVANIALRLLRLLFARGIEPNLMRDYGLTQEDPEVVIILGALLHDAGMSIHRDDHELMSLFVALPKLQELLRDIYPVRQRRIVVSETLHAIITHQTGSRPLTLEAGIIRLADALDMAHGRSRIPFEAGYRDIHPVSAQAIESVEIGPGTAKAIRVGIHMSNAAGLFQIDALLREKLKGSGLEPYVEVVADVAGEADKRLFETLEF
jgi:metal-dependent HD superfamily phosphatase/phosphodiesterase